MGLAHPAINTRDTALFLSFRRTLGYRPRAMVPLAELVKRFMGRDIEQNGDIPVSAGCVHVCVRTPPPCWADGAWSRSKRRGPPWTSSGPANRSGKASSPPGPGRAPCPRTSIDSTSPERTRVRTTQAPLARTLPSPHRIRTSHTPALSSLPCTPYSSSDTPPSPRRGCT